MFGRSTTTPTEPATQSLLDADSIEFDVQESFR